LGEKHCLEAHEKGRLEAAETAKETSAHRQATCSSPEVCKAVQKTLLQKNRVIFFFRTNAQNICFSCLIPKMTLFEALRRAKCLLHTGKKNAQNESSGAE